MVVVVAVVGQICVMLPQVIRAMAVLVAPGLGVMAQVIVGLVMAVRLAMLEVIGVNFMLIETVTALCVVVLEVPLVMGVIAVKAVGIEIAEMAPSTVAKDVALVVVAVVILI